VELKRGIKQEKVWKKKKKRKRYGKRRKKENIGEKNKRRRKENALSKFQSTFSIISRDFSISFIEAA